MFTSSQCSFYLLQQVSYYNKCYLNKFQEAAYRRKFEEERKRRIEEEKEREKTEIRTVVSMQLGIHIAKVMELCSSPFKADRM